MFITIYSFLFIKLQFVILGPNLYLIYRCTSFFLFAPDVTYSATTHKYCNRNGNINTFSNLDAAKASCSADAECVGLFDDCGRGIDFRHCNSPLTIVVEGVDGCGSILYQPIGK